MPISAQECEDCATRFGALVMGSAAEPDNCISRSHSIGKIYWAFSAHSGNGMPDTCPTPAQGRCGAPPCMVAMCGTNSRFSSAAGICASAAGPKREVGSKVSSDRARGRPLPPRAVRWPGYKRRKRMTPF